MGSVVVAGLINIETTVKVDGFPIDYVPVRYPFFGVQASVSGVGYNVAKALTVLGSAVRFLSLVGKDAAGREVHATLAEDGIPAGEVHDLLDETPRSVILYAPDGRRMIHVDLKAIQETVYPGAALSHALEGASLAALCNINFARDGLRMAQARGIPIATDVHAISDLADGYNRDFMAASQVLFMSDEHLPCAPEEWARRVWDRYGTPVIVIGLGAAGALLAVKDDGFVERVPAVFTRPVVNTIGAGDALFSCFVHFYNKTGDPYASLRKAVVFASYKIGTVSAADGFVSEDTLDAICERL